MRHVLVAYLSPLPHSGGNKSDVFGTVPVQQAPLELRLCCFPHLLFFRPTPSWLSPGLFCGRRPLPFGGSHLRLPSGPAGIRTTYRQSVSAGKTNALPTEPSGRLCGFRQVVQHIRFCVASSPACMALCVSVFFSFFVCVLFLAIRK